MVTVSVDCEYGPTVAGREAFGPFLAAGEIVALRLTVLLKSFVPVIVTVNVADAPLLIVWLVGLTVIVKSGGPVTVTDKVVECASDPLAPVIVIE